MTFQSSSITNGLLAVIAALLLIQVVQNTQSYRPAVSNNSFHQVLESGNEMPPPLEGHVDGHEEMPAASPHGAMGGFQLMAALSCPGNASLTLADTGCSGPEANKVRSFVDDLGHQGLPISQMFDKIVATFGEKALTPQALDIRRSRGK